MKNLINFYFSHKKLCLLLAACAVAGVLFGAPDAAFAQGEPADPEVTNLLKGINEIFNMLLRLSSALLWPVILMIGSLLDNELIFGGAMGERLLGIWVQMRNLVNIAFVLILLAIALYNVLGLSEETGGMALAFKTIMPKFVLALIAVNFSFLGVKVVLDFTNVITGAVFSLPTTVIEGNNYDLSEQMKATICGTANNEAPMRAAWCNENELNERAKNFFSRLDRTNITMVYAIRFGHAPQLKYIRDGVKGLGQLGFNIIFNTVLYMVYALSFIALFVVLLFRVVGLWIAVVFSPLIALTIVLPNLKELGGEGGKIQEQFTNFALAPIKIGLVLSIGYIMLDGFEADKSIHGELLSSNALAAIDPFSLPTDIHDLQQFMIAITVIVVVWMGVFSAAETTAAKVITGQIREKAEAFGKWTAKLPTYAQIIPTGAAGKELGQEHLSLAEIGATIKDVPGKVQDTWGRSLFAPPRPDQASLQPWREAREGDVKKLAKAIADAPHVLKTPEGFRLFQEGIMKHDRIDEKKFKETYGDGTNPDATAKGIFQNTKLMNEVRNENSALTSESAIRSAIERVPAARIGATKDDVLKALTAGTKAADLAKEDVFKDGGWKEADIESLQKWTDDEARKAIIEANMSGNKLQKFDVTIANTFATKAAELSTKPGDAGLIKILKDSSLPLPQKKSIVKLKITETNAQKAALDAIEGTTK